MERRSMNTKKIIDITSLRSGVKTNGNTYLLAIVSNGRNCLKIIYNYSNSGILASLAHHLLPWTYTLR